MTRKEIKMKKTVAAILLLCLTVALFACSGNALPATENLTVVEGDYHAVESVPAAYDYRRVSDPVPKEFTLFGKQYTLYLTDVSTRFGYYETDHYVGSDLFLSARTDTGKIVSYQTVPTYAKDYVSPVGEGSTEEEYIAYANSVILDLTGVSTEGWEATVGFFSTKYKTQLADRTDYTINKNGAMITASEEEYEAAIGTGVTVTYRKKIGGFARCDAMTVKMSSVGEIISVNAVNYDEWFAPFSGVTPDRARIEQAVWPLASSYTHGYSSRVEKIEMLVSDNTLWAEVSILITGSEGASAGVAFYVEVAKIAQ